MQRIERLYAIGERLRRAAPAVVPAHQLAGEPGVTRRTIERDLAALRNAGVPPYATAERTAIGKLLDLLDEPGRVAVDSLRDRFRVAVPDTHPVLPRVRSVLEDAVRAQTVVRLAFTDRNGVRTTRAVEPIGFYSTEGAWSLVAWCRLRDGGRLFRLGQIERATATRERFEARDIDHVLGWVPRPGTTP